MDQAPRALGGLFHLILGWLPLPLAAPVALVVAPISHVEALASPIDSLLLLLIG